MHAQNPVSGSFKAASAPMITTAPPAYMLDSTIDRNATGGLIRKYVYQYDENGRTVDQAMYGPVNNTSWKGYSRQKLRYDAAGRNVMSESLQWDEASSDWVTTYKSISAFNKDGKPTLSESYSRSGNVLVGETKQETLYDVLGIALGQNYWIWDQTLGNWQLLMKSVSSKSGNDVLINSYYWMSTINDWVSMSKKKVTYTLNPQGDLASTVGYDWVEEKSSWQQSQKAEMSYNTDRKLVKQEVFSMDTTSKTWVLQQQFLKDYDTQGRLILDEFNALNAFTLQMIGQSKTASAFDGAGRQTYSESFFWDAATGKWMTNNRIVAAYNADGQITLNETYFWDNMQSAVLGINKYETTYGANKLPETVLSYYWDNNLPNGANWVLRDKTVHFYDAENFLTKKEKSSWNTDSKTWFFDDRTNNTWSVDRSQVTEINEHFNSSSWVNISKAVKRYDAYKNMSYLENFSWNVGSWKSSGSTSYYYAPFAPVVALKTPSKPSIDLWSSDSYLHIATGPVPESIQIYSMDGRLVTTQHVQGTYQQSLPKGIYLVKTKSGTQKIVVR